MHHSARFEELSSIINHLSGERAIVCLRVMLNDEVSNGTSIFGSPAELPEMLAGIIAKNGGMVHPLKDADLPDLGSAAKTLLLAALESDNMQDRVEGALQVNAREMLFEPVSGMLAIAGVLMLLKTNLDIKIKRGPDGKWVCEGKVNSKSLSEDFLKKLLDIFTTSP
ncbi:hypothetical protein [Caballeronia sp. LjRoot31]|uniref:hypothetical protein n=1 Tax=Caballeronia sp. LjRoot31 TaxID=3342324 RepID=UPI003ECF5C99